MSTRMAGDKFSPEEIREKFGLKFNEEHSKMSAPGAYSRDSGGDGFAHDNGAIFTQDGTYVGSVKGDGDEEYYAGYKSLIDAASPYKEKKEGKGFSSVDSLSDVAGAVRFLTDGEAQAPAPTEESEGYTWSEPVVKAKAYVDAFDESYLPNQGQIIFGTDRGKQAAQEFSDNYKLNLIDYQQPRNHDGSLYDPDAEEAAVAGAGTVGTVGTVGRIGPQ